MIAIPTNKTNQLHLQLLPAGYVLHRKIESSVGIMICRCQQIILFIKCEKNHFADVRKMV